MGFNWGRALQSAGQSLGSYGQMQMQQAQRQAEIEAQRQFQLERDRIAYENQLALLDETNPYIDVPPALAEYMGLNPQEVYGPTLPGMATEVAPQMRVGALSRAMGMIPEPVDPVSTEVPWQHDFGDGVIAYGTQAGPDINISRIVTPPSGGSVGREEVQPGMMSDPFGNEFAPSWDKFVDYAGMGYTWDGKRWKVSAPEQYDVAGSLGYTGYKDGEFISGRGWGNWAQDETPLEIAAVKIKEMIDAAGDEFIAYVDVKNALTSPPYNLTEEELRVVLPKISDLDIPKIIKNREEPADEGDEFGGW